MSAEPITENTAEEEISAPMPDLLTAITVARRSGLSRSTIDRAIHSGELPARRRGSLMLVKREDYQHWVDNIGEPVVPAT
ncbi:MAG: excisionase family DNA-binding protein [Henriciella sp.]